MYFLSFGDVLHFQVFSATMAHFILLIQSRFSQRWVWLVTLPKFTVRLFSLYLLCVCMYMFHIIYFNHVWAFNYQASVEKNAREIKEYIEEIYWGSKKRVLLFGHSKGGVDSAAALSLYWSDLKDKVAGLVLAQSPYGGSPIASDLLREGQLGDYVKLRTLTEILICKVLKVNTF